MPRKKQSTSAANPALKNQAKEESAPAEEASIISAPALQPPSTPSRAVKKNESQKESESQNEEKSNDIKFSTPHADKRSKAPSFSNEKKSASRRGRGQAGDEQDTTRSRLDLTSTPSKEKPSSAAATTVETGVSLSTSASPRSNYAKLAVDGRVEDVYRILRLTTGQLGGNGYSGAIYGELTMRSMQRVLNIMTKKCGLNADSRFIDVGAGLGKPNFHAAQDPAVRLSIGIELEDIRWKLSMHNMQNFLTALQGGDRAAAVASPVSDENHDGNSPTSPPSKAAAGSADRKTQKQSLNGGVNFVLGDIDDAHSLDPFTHIYMFDLGFPPPLQKSIAKKFNQSLYAKCLVSYRPPRRVIEEYGYAVDFVDQVLCSMHGSGEGHTAYFYMRNNTPPRTPKLPQQQLLTLPLKAKQQQEGQLQQEECKQQQQQEQEQVYADKVFFTASKLAVGPTADLVAYVDGEMAKYVEGARPKRERKQRIITDASAF